MDKWFVEEKYNGKWIPAKYNRHPSQNRYGGANKVFRNDPIKLPSEDAEKSLKFLQKKYGGDK